MHHLSYGGRCSELHMLPYILFSEHCCEFEGISYLLSLNVSIKTCTLFAFSCCPFREKSLKGEDCEARTVEVRYKLNNNMCSMQPQNLNFDTYGFKFLSRLNLDSLHFCIL